MNYEEFHRRCCKTQNEAPLNPPRRVEEQSEEAPSNSPKGERAKLLGVKSEEQR